MGRQKLRYNFKVMQFLLALRVHPQLSLGIRNSKLWQFFALANCWSKEQPVFDHAFETDQCAGNRLRSKRAYFDNGECYIMMSFLSPECIFWSNASNGQWEERHKINFLSTKLILLWEDKKKCGKIMQNIKPIVNVIEC